MNKNKFVNIIKEGTESEEMFEGVIVASEKTNEKIKDSDKYAYLVQLEALHVMQTTNKWMYTVESLESGVESWTNPYRKPVILYHKDEDGKMIGRVIDCYVKKKGTRSGTPAWLLTILISDEQGVKDLEAGLLTTVSVGITSQETYCTICGQNINQYGLCGHKRGSLYEVENEDTGETSIETCYHYSKSLTAKELSYVISPSDKYAHNISVKKVKQPKNGFQSYLNTKSKKKSIESKERTLEDFESIVIKESEDDSDMTKEEMKALLKQAQTDISIKEGDEKPKENTEPKGDIDNNEPKKEKKPDSSDNGTPKEPKVEEKDWKQIATEAMGLLAEMENSYTQAQASIVELKKESFNKSKELADAYSQTLSNKTALANVGFELKEAIDYIAREKEIEIKEGEEIFCIADILENIRIKESSSQIEEPKEPKKDISIKEGIVKDPTLQGADVEVKKNIKIQESTDDLVSAEKLADYLKM